MTNLGPREHVLLQEVLKGLQGFAMDEAPPVTAMDDSARTVDTNGWYEVAGNPLSKVGVFPYRGSQIPGAPDPDAVYQVLRPEEELSHPDCIASFRLLPWIDNHVMLGSEEDGLTPADRKGIHGVIGEQVEFRDGVLYGNIKVFSQSLASAIENGKRELSCGYRCRYEPITGVHDGKAYDYVQRDIRGNHLALVQSGRMGPDVAVLDESDPVQQPEGADMADETGKNEGGGSGSGELSLAAALEAIKGIMPAIQMVMAAAGGSTPPAAVDATPPAPDDKKTDDGGAPPAPPAGKTDDDKKEATGMDAKSTPTLRDLMAQIAKRDALARSLSEHVGAFDHSLMTEADVAAYGVKKLGITAPAGAEVATLAGYLAGAAVPRKQPVSGMDEGVTKTSGIVSGYINGKKGA